ncbi:hypothetical protein Gotur_033746, partial [Gossypium turneri]
MGWSFIDRFKHSSPPWPAEIWGEEAGNTEAVLVFIMAGCFFREMSYVKPPASGVVKGIFVPKLNGQRAIDNAIALLGALVM